MVHQVHAVNSLSLSRGYFLDERRHARGSPTRLNSNLRDTCMHNWTLDKERFWRRRGNDRAPTRARAFSKKARERFYRSSSATLPSPPLIFIVFPALTLRLYPLALALFSVLAKQRRNHDASNDRAPNRRTDRRGKYIFSVNSTHNPWDRRENNPAIISFFGCFVHVGTLLRHSDYV